MKKTILFVIMLMLTGSVHAQANAIQQIDLDYDIEEQILSVSIEHVSRDRREEYIRKVIIYRNGGFLLDEYYNIQRDPARFEEDYEIEAREGDEITVEAFAAEGGKKSASIIVKPKEEPEEKQSQNPSSKSTQTPPVKGSGY